MFAALEKRIARPISGKGGKNQNYKNRMNSTVSWLAAVTVAIACVSQPARGQITTQHSFSNSPDGANPLRLTAANGTLFGVTTGGGANHAGTLFTFNPTSLGFSTFYSFPGSINAGFVPNNLLVSGNQIYGTGQMAGNNGVGVVYAVGTNGTGYITLHTFLTNNSDGQNPAGSLVLSGGSLYGTTAYGGTHDNGTVFKINPDGSGYSVLHSFSNTPDGSQPQSELVSDGTRLYGTTYQGGANNYGMIFAINPDGTGFTTLHSFANAPEPMYPYGGLVFNNGVLYGSGSGGGANNTGAIFSLNTDGSGFRTLYSFSASGGNADGEEPEATLTLNGGLLYGTAVSGGSSGGGTIFMLHTDGSGFSVIGNFAYSSASGADPIGGVIWLDTALWGTTFNGGLGGVGTFFDVAFQAPAITQQPQNETVPAGGSASFTTAATGTAPLSYQWYFNNTPLAGQNSSGLALASAGSGQAGSYTVVVTNLYGSATSSAALLTVVSPTSPVITQQPQNATGTNGDAAAFTVEASGSAPLYYQWYFETSTLISGATGATLTLSPVSPSMAGSYSVVVSNSAGSVTSTPAQLTVVAALLPPAITQQPQTVAVTNGYTATFTSAASGVAPLYYQWYFNTNTALAGATNAILSLPFVAASQAGYYNVVVSDSGGSASSLAAKLTVISTKPIIVGQPQPISATNGEAVSFTVVAAGAAPLKYQWYTNSVTAAHGQRGATNSTLALTASAALAQEYLVVVTNSLGRATSSPALLSVVTKPVITLNPVGLTVINGEPSSFTAAAVGAGALSYQWLFHTNVLVPGATNTSLAFTNTYSTLAGYYALRATNTFGSVTSSYALLTVQTQLNFLSFNFDRADGSPSFVLANAVGSTNRLWGSSNLARAWFPVATNVMAANGLWFFTDTSSALSNSVRLYRFSTP